MDRPPRDQRHQYLSFEGLEYKDAKIMDFDERLGMGLHTVDEIESIGFTAYWAESARQIPTRGSDLLALLGGVRHLRR
nr:hypothetical protein [Tanacetum cinerariifolium]